MCVCVQPALASGGALSSGGAGLDGVLGRRWESDHSGYSFVATFSNRSRFRPFRLLFTPCCLFWNFSKSPMATRVLLLLLVSTAHGAQLASSRARKPTFGDAKPQLPLRLRGGDTSSASMLAAQVCPALGLVLSNWLYASPIPSLKVRQLVLTPRCVRFGSPPCRARLDGYVRAGAGVCQERLTRQPESAAIGSDGREHHRVG